VEGPTSWYWNPAGAANADGFGAALSRSNLYQDLDISHNYVGVSLPLGSGVLGVSATTLSSGDIARTTEDFPYGDPTVGNVFSWSSTAVGIGYSRRLTDRLNVGGQIKYVSEGLNDASISWGALDLGTQFRTGLYGLTVGAAVANIGPSSRMSGTLIDRVVNSDQFSNQRTRVSYNTQETDLPTLFRFSVGTELYGRTGSLYGQGGSQHTLDGDVTFNGSNETNVQLGVGLEYGFRNLFFVRGGKRFYNDDRVQGEGTKGTYGLSGGLGLRLPLSGRALRFDYAYTALGELQNVQVFSFELGR
jgi:hypothetical protein